MATWIITIPGAKERSARREPREPREPRSDDRQRERVNDRDRHWATK